MDVKSARRLRILGLFVLALFFVFAFAATTAMGSLDSPYKDALATTLAIGIGLLLLAEITPLIKSMKAGGVELEFLSDSVTDRCNEFETRLCRLEWIAAGRDRTMKDVLDRKHKPPPGLALKQRCRNDPWKGRFGGQAARDGFVLSAEFRHVGTSSVQILIRVTAPDTAKPSDLECVDLYLHDSFHPDVVPAVFHGREAELSLLSYGGFTVGAWVACRGVELELDLAELPDAPQVIREN